MSNKMIYKEKKMCFKVKIKTLILFIAIFILPHLTFASERIGTVGIVIGKADVVNRNLELKIKESIHFGDVIKTGPKTNMQILFDDQTVFTIGENTEIVINEFIYDPNQNNELNKISAEIFQGSLKVVTGLISKKNPENLSITLPTGVLATRGTEVQALVRPNEIDYVVLLGPGPNNSAGERAGAIEVTNNQGSVFMDQQFSFTSIEVGQPPAPPQPAPAALINEINQSLNAGTVSLQAENTQEESETLEEETTAEQEDTTGETEIAAAEEASSDEITKISSKAVNDEVKTVISEEFDTTEGLLKASIPKVMTLVATAKTRGNELTETETDMIVSVNRLMNAKLSTANLLIDETFMENFNNYLTSYIIAKAPKLEKNIATKVEARMQKKNLENKSPEQIAKIEERVKGNITKKVTKQQSKKIVKKAKQKAKQKAKKAKQKAKQKAKKAKQKAKKAKQKAKKAAKIAKKKAKSKRRQKVAAGSTTKWKEVFTKKSGTYTFDANSISLAASTGSGGGTIDADSTINFGNKTIAVTYAGTNIQLGGQSTRNFTETRTRSYSGSSGNNDYVDSNGYLRETMNFNIKENGNTNTMKIRQRGADTLQSLTGLDRSKSDVDTKWDPTGSDNWYFVNTNFQGTNGSGSGSKNVANEGTFSIAIENWDPDTNVISNKIEGSATVAKD